LALLGATREDYGFNELWVKKIRQLRKLQRYQKKW